MPEATNLATGGTSAKTPSTPVMSKRLVCAIAGIVALLIAINIWNVNDRSNSTVTPAELQLAPLTIAASAVGDFGAEVYPWWLTVNSAGEAELTIETVPQRTRKRFVVSPERLAEFRQALIETRFFDLKHDYGEHVPDGSTSSLSVTAGQHTNSVQVHFLGNWMQSSRSKLREPSRALKLLDLVRVWFEDAEAVDQRKNNRMILDAVN